jgi:transcriptional regulator with XRE-family HTH domain
MNTVTNDEVKENLAENLRRILASRGWTGLKLAAESGESQPTISNILRAQHVPNAGTLSRIAKTLDTTMDYLISKPEAIGPKRREREFAETA